VSDISTPRSYAPLRLLRLAPRHCLPARIDTAAAPTSLRSVASPLVCWRPESRRGGGEPAGLPRSLGSVLARGCQREREGVLGVGGCVGGHVHVDRHAPGGVGDACAEVTPAVVGVAGGDGDPGQRRAKRVDEPQSRSGRPSGWAPGADAHLDRMADVRRRGGVIGLPEVADDQIAEAEAVSGSPPTARCWLNSAPATRSCAGPGRAPTPSGRGRRCPRAAPRK
jgi:hypothetical protein